MDIIVIEKNDFIKSDIHDNKFLSIIQALVSEYDCFNDSDDNSHIPVKASWKHNKHTTYYSQKPKILKAKLHLDSIERTKRKMNNYINILNSSNIDSVSNNIKHIITNTDSENNLKYIDTILKNAILHKPYINLYVRIIKDNFDSEIIKQSVSIFYEYLISLLHGVIESIAESKTSYDSFCDINLQKNKLCNGQHILCIFNFDISEYVNTLCGAISLYSNHEIIDCIIDILRNLFSVYTGHGIKSLYEQVKITCEGKELSTRSKFSIENILTQLKSL
jgi:hypothetical protein